jgi:hypothetical protein
MWRTIVSETTTFFVRSEAGSRIDLGEGISPHVDASGTWARFGRDGRIGFRLDVDDAYASAEVDVLAFTFTERSSEGAPAQLAERVRGVTLDYLYMCVRLGAFVLEEAPIGGSDGTVIAPSLRVALGKRGISWLGDLPETSSPSHSRAPTREELTVIAPPPEEEPGDAPPSPRAPR